jgi:hypothetical protein
VVQESQTAGYPDGWRGHQKKNNGTDRAVRQKVSKFIDEVYEVKAALQRNVSFHTALL